jgi:ATP-binding cassette, subfamily B (MDR/TAP), member 1
LATLPISAIILSVATKRLEPAIRAQRVCVATASQHATASLAAIDLVKVFRAYDQELWQYYRAISAAARHYIVQATCNSFQIGYVSFWVVALFVIGFAYGVVLVDGGLEPGHIITTFYATLASIQGIEAIMPHWLVLAKGMSAGGFLSDFARQLHGRSQVRRTAAFIKPEHCVGDVQVTNVSGMRRNERFGV